MIRFLLSVWKLDNTLSILVSKGLIKQSGEKLSNNTSTWLFDFEKHMKS
jgi:hypothetical protein